MFSPPLQELDIWLVLHNNQELHTGNGDALLSQARWPNLRRIRLYAVHCTPERTSRFLVDHPRITELSISQHVEMPDNGSELPSGILPQLKTLYCDLKTAVAVLGSLSASHSISHIGLSDCPFDPLLLKSRFCNLLKGLLNLKQLEFVRQLSLENIIQIAEAAPLLEWLRIAFWPIPVDDEVCLTLLKHSLFQF
jgi:hypothetical protein